MTNKTMAHSFKFFARWLIDGTGRNILENVLAEVEKGLILSIKAGQNYDPGLSDLLDFSTCTVLPGLIDCHTHIFMSGTNDPEVRKQQLDSPFEDMKSVISNHLHQQLAHGIVAIRDGGDYAGHALRYKKECLPSEGLPIRLKTAGRAWRSPGRYGKLIGRPPAKGMTLAQSVAMESKGMDHVKIVNSGLNSLTRFGKETPAQFSLEQLKPAIRTAGNLGLKTMIHANGELPVRLAIEAGCHSIEHGFFMGEKNLNKMAEKQITWVPTACTMKAYQASLDPYSLEAGISKKNLDHQSDQISKAIQCGVSIAAGTDCGSLGVHHGFALKEELGLLIEAGMSLEKAIQCATLNGAKLLGLEDRLGRLGKGMPATFVVLDGAPSMLPGILDTPKTIFFHGRKWKPSTTG